MLWFLLILLMVAAGGAILFGDGGTIMGIQTEMAVGALASIAILIFLAGGLRDYAGRLGTAARDMALWVGVGLALILGYSYRDDLKPIWNRIAGELSPPGTNLAVSGTGQAAAVRVRKRVDGHFAVNMQVNGRPVRMLVDTGASSVVLTTDDARRAGIDVDRLSFAIPVSTANGTGFAAAVTLDAISIGAIRKGRLRALVAKPGALGESLLGMNFLRSLRSYEFEGDFLTLRG